MELPEADRTTRITAERRELPDSPGVYLFHDAKGKVLGTRTWKYMLLGSPGVVKSLLLRDASCAGPITIDATFNGQHKKTTVQMACGE